MATQQRLWAEFQSLFDQDLPVTTELLDLLQRERQALESRDYTTFQQLLGNKQQFLTALENHARVRLELLQNAGFADEAGALSAAEIQAPPIARTWRKLGEQWRQCQELNAVNERIAQRTRLVVGQVLDLLRGTSGNAKLYDSKGSTQNTGGGHTITSA